MMFTVLVLLMVIPSPSHGCYRLALGGGCYFLRLMTVWLCVPQSSLCDGGLSRQVLPLHEDWGRRAPQQHCFQTERSRITRNQDPSRPGALFETLRQHHHGLWNCKSKLINSCGYGQGILCFVFSCLKPSYLTDGRGKLGGTLWLVWSSVWKLEMS